MDHRVVFRFAFVALFAAGALHPAVAAAQNAKAPAPKTYVVQAGEDLPGLAAKLKPQNATVNQMGVALVQANQRTIWQRYDRSKEPRRS